MKVDKSLQEVWDWKDKVYEETKHLSVRETGINIHEDVQQIKRKNRNSFDNPIEIKQLGKNIDNNRLLQVDLLR